MNIFILDITFTEWTEAICIKALYNTIWYQKYKLKVMLFLYDKHFNIPLELEIRSVTTILKAMMSVSDGVIIIVRVGRYRNCPFKAVVIGGQSVKCHFLFTNNCERLVISWESFQIFTAIQTTDFQIYTASTIFTNSLQSVTQRNYAQRTNKHAFFKFHTKSYKNICRGWIGKKHAILNFILSTRLKR